MSELLPTGTVTLLLADVEGSTRLWEAQPDAMTVAFTRLDRLLAELLATHRGARPVEQGEGDSFVLAFERASDAMACALELQRAALAPIRLRIGMHTGEVQLRNAGNYIGPTINTTARIRDLGHGGQTLLSGATEEMVRDRLPLDAWVTDLGIYPLKGVARPERVVQLCQADVRNEFPPLRHANYVVSHNLPEEITSFVGRAEEIKCVRRLVADNRLVTVTGAGGAGKTRLSLQVAADLADDYGWVRYIALAPVADPEDVSLVVGRAVGVSDRPDQSTTEALIRVIGERRMLMVLDNCEHLLDASARLCLSLLGTCPRLSILATSREPLGVTGEVTWRIPSLSIADDATELFADRAQRARQDFVLDDSNTAAVKEICERLDGMPLAIELAAARVRALSLEDIAQGLHDRFSLLTGGARTLMPRQQTLRASVDWSHALLAAPERTLFRRLAVFAGGFDLDAATVVAAGSELDRYEVLDLVTSLVDKSLVVAEDVNGQIRYRLLETVRQYATEELEASDETAEVRKRHRDHYFRILDLLGTRARSRYGQLLEQAAADIANLRAAFAGSADLDPDGDTLTRAARGAAWLADVPLAERLADAAIGAGAGVEAFFVRAHSLSLLNLGAEADALLNELNARDLTDDHHAELIFLRATNALLTCADSAAAKTIADEALERATSPTVRACVYAFLAVYSAASGDSRAAIEICERLADAKDTLPDVAARMTAWASALAFGDAGRTTDAVVAAEGGYPVPVRGLTFITDAHVGALLLAGHVEDAQQMAAIFSTRATVYATARFHQVFSVVKGRAALGGGRLNDSLTALEPAASMFAAAGAPQGWDYRAQISLTTVLAMSGMAAKAQAASSELDRLAHPGWGYLDFERGLARGWVLACRGAVGGAIREALSAADIARGNGQFAAEVMCLQTAVQFGDRSCAARLSVLQTVVEGPRAGLAFRLAAALEAEDADEMASVSGDLEKMGDTVAALDAAAHAVIAFRRCGAEEAASHGYRRTAALAERTGAITPALVAARNC